MSFVQIFIVCGIGIILPAVTLATDNMVGDGRGWDFAVDYQAWAQNTKFYVGDRLVFKYQKGDHNVYKVDELGFQACTPLPGSIPLATGNDVIDLTTPGKKWYICGIPMHCSNGGQKLSITVLPKSAVKFDSPPSMPLVPGSANGIQSSMYQVTIVAAMAIGLIVNLPWSELHF